MVKEYLDKIKDEYIENKLSISEKLTSAENHYKENIKMIQMLEDSEDPNFEAFTPRQVNSYNRSKISELNEQQRLIEAQIKVLHNDLAEINRKIDEVTSVIRVYRNDMSSVNTVSNTSAGSEDTNLMILERVELERQRIARDLHDSSVQSLTSLLHKTELCMKLIDLDPIRCKLELSSNSKILKDVINEMRNMIYNLRPMSFDDIGFDITVERVLDKLKQINNIRYSFDIKGQPYELKNIYFLSLLRIIQEACSNSVKHGEADFIKVILEYVKNYLNLLIEDDGKGFDISTIPESTRNDNSGFGLSMMKERVTFLSGTMDIDSSIGNGCKININIPINREEIDNGH